MRWANSFTDCVYPRNEHDSPTQLRQPSWLLLPTGGKTHGSVEPTVRKANRTDRFEFARLKHLRWLHSKLIKEDHFACNHEDVLSSLRFDRLRCVSKCLPNRDLAWTISVHPKRPDPHPRGYPTIHLSKSESLREGALYSYATEP